MVPACTSTRCLTIVKPSPRPVKLLFNPVFGWLNRSKRWGRKLALIPRPVSVTAIFVLTVNGTGRYGDVAAGRGELDGVADQIPDNLLQPAIIPHHVRIKIRHLPFERDFPRLREGCEHGLGGL